MDTQDWTANEFMAFIMFYACEANGRLTQTDCDWIKGRVGDASFQKAEAVFKSRVDIEMIEIIADMRKRFFPGEEGKSKIHQDLVGLFKSDGKFTSMEHHVLHEIERLF
ncbi:MAG: hypothetical protein IPL65_06250 [Lewinellaceae bacterium]|nr:hypothetical protein [Lewinellaceae bacterium]